MSPKTTGCQAGKTSPVEPASTPASEDLQVEVKALALKLERSAAPNNKTKKAKAQVKAAQVKAPPAEVDSRFDSCSNISVPASSDLDDIVSNLNKSLPPLNSLRLLPNQFRMDLLSEEDQQPSTQADQMYM